MLLDDAKNLVKSLDDGIKTFVSNVSYYPKDSLYIPDKEKESVLERFAKGIGIGSQEIGKVKTTPYTIRHGYQTHLGRAPHPEEHFVNYSHAFFDRIPNTALAALRNTKIDDEAFAKAIQLPEGDIAADIPNLEVGEGLSGAIRKPMEDTIEWNYDIPSLLGYYTGALGADIAGHGTRKWFWNMNPEDALGTATGLMAGNPNSIQSIGLQPSSLLSNAVRFGTAAGLGITVGNWDPMNMGEGGRPLGYEAITPDENDPRQSTQPVLDLLVSRGLLGRNARLLPWEQFREERPDVTFDEYQAYKDYLYNRDPGLLSKMTLGLVKGTPEGIDGDSPELRVLGYRVTPEGIVGAGIGASVPLLAAKYIQDRKRVVDDVKNVATAAVRTVL